MRLWILLASGAFVACGHTKTVEEPTATEAAAPAAPAKQPKRAPVKETAPAASVPLASDPLQMLTSDGREALRQSLRKRDLLPDGSSIATALRKFQKQEGLPETGMPDDETLIKLDLDPKKVSVRSKPTS